MKKVTVLGAGSFLALPLMPELLKDHNVLAVSRQPNALNPSIQKCRLESLIAQKQESAYLVSLMPIWETARHLPNLKLTGLTKVVAISSSSVLTKLQSNSSTDRELANKLLQAENSLETYLKERAIKLVILRPTMVFGYYRDKNVSFLLKILQKTHMMPYLGKASGLRQPLYADDLARAIVLALRSDLSYQRLALGGETVLSYRQMVNEIASVAKLSYLPLQIPRFAIKTMIGLLKRRYAFLDIAMFDRMNQDLIVKNDLAENSLSFKPLSFSASLVQYLSKNTLEKSN